MTSPSRPEQPEQRELYDPEREAWYRGTAPNGTRTYYDKGRNQWVTVANPPLAIEAQAAAPEQDEAVRRAWDRAVRAADTETRYWLENIMREEAAASPPPAPVALDWLLARLDDDPGEWVVDEYGRTMPEGRLRGLIEQAARLTRQSEDQ